MNAAAACRRQVKVRAGAPAVLGPVVVAVRLEVRHDGCSGTEANVEFLKSVGVDKIELNVLVATGLAGLGVLLPEQIQIGTLRLGTAFGRRAGILVRVGGITRRLLLCIARRLGRGGLRRTPEGNRQGEEES